MKRIVIGCPRTALLAACVLVVVSGCGHTSHPEIKMQPLDQMIVKPPSTPPALIAIRVLVTAYHGAHGAPPDQQRTKSEALERARMLSSMAKSGDQLVGLVSKYSDRAGAAEDLGAFQLRPAKPTPFDDTVAHAALALTVGGISEPVETPDGYLVIERLKDPSAGPERIAAKHILIGYAGSPQAVPGVTRSEAAARTLVAEVYKRVITPGADWNSLANEYTDEPGGKHTGGDLGKFGHGQMVPAFDRAAFALEVGQISKIIQSPFGFHIIQRYQ